MNKPRILVLDLNANPCNGTWAFATQFDRGIRELGLACEIFTFTRSGKLSVGHAQYDNLWALSNKEGSKFAATMQEINENWDFVIFNNQGQASYDAKMVDKKAEAWWTDLEANLVQQPWWRQILDNLKIPFSIFIHCLPVSNRKHYPLIELFTKHPQFCGTLVAKHPRISQAFNDDYMFKSAVAGVNWVYFSDLPMGTGDINLLQEVSKLDRVIMTSRITNSKGIIEMLEAMPLIQGEVLMHGAIMEAGNQSAKDMYRGMGYTFPDSIFPGAYTPDDLPQIFRQAKVHCDLSRDSGRGVGNAGGLNYVTLEAMTYGVLPIVSKTWNTRGWKSIPTVDPENKQQLADTINYFLTHDDERIEMILENAKLLQRHYDRRRVAGNILQELGLVTDLVSQYVTA
jgi:glycosyltransferase involved in cell wall biosynthesis